MKKKFLSFYHKVSWINVKLSFSAMLLFFTFVFVQAVAGVPVFNISTMDKVVNVSPGDTANVLYTIRNNSGLNIADAEYIPSYFTSISSFSNCPTNLLKDETCNLVLTLHAPQSMGSIFLIPFRVCGFSGQMCGIADKNNHIRVNVTQTAEGHFVFRQSSTDITTLDLAPGATGSVILHNSGGSTISGYSLNIPTAVSGYFSGDCTSVTSLAAGASCNLAYTIPSTPVTGMYSLTASGTNADNSPHVLSVTIATQGHFVFRQGATDVTTLDLTPGAIGSVTLHNTGGSTISGYSLNIPAAVSGYFSGDCTTVTSLAAGASCNLAYTIPSTPVTGMHSLTVSGTNADNSPHVLSVTIATQGHFVFRQGATDITTLDLAPGATGSVTLHNTGGSTISGYSLNIPAAVSGYFSGDCTSVTSLAAGASCNLAYTIPGSPVTGMHSLTASGTNADNTPHTLTVGISVPVPRAYFAVFGSRDIWQCEINPSTGAFSNCGDTTGSQYYLPTDITFNPAGTRAFVTNTQSNLGAYVTRCDVDASNGTFSNCSDTGASGFGHPDGIALNATGTVALVVNGATLPSNDTVLEVTH